MSKQLVICPSCGAEVQLDRYCSACGSPLMPDIERVLKEDSGIEDRSTETTVPKTMPEPDEHSDEHVDDEGYLPELSVMVDDVDYLALTYLMSQSELAILDRELDSMIEKIRATRSALALEHADKQVLASRARELKEALERTKARKNELLRVRLSIPLHVLAGDLRSEKTKLEKLEKIASTVDPQVYREQQQELKERIKVLKREVKREIKTARSWLKAMGRKQREIEREINRLDARHKIGDIPTSQYEQLRGQTERSLQVLIGGIRLLERMVRDAEKI